MSTVVQYDRELLRADVGGSPDPSPDKTTVKEVYDLTTQDREGGMA